MESLIRTFKNNTPLPSAECPATDSGRLKELVQEAVEQNQAHISALFCVPDNSGKAKLYCILNYGHRGELGIVSATVAGSYPALTTGIPQAHWFEREIYEIHGIEPVGHPWLKPIRSLFPPAGEIINKKYNNDFFILEGEAVHEVAVGPVHAGVIEPGHFRFQCHGETVHHLEISLGYQHRGIEKAIARGPDKKTIHYMETLAGDSTAGHTLAYCQVLEALSSTPVSLYAQSVRCIAAELERLANHIGDLGALAGDVGFLPSQNYCGRIRGDVLNLTGELCSNRFSRGLIIPGGVNTTLDNRNITGLLKKLAAIERDFKNAADLIFNTPSVLARLEGTGKLSRELAIQIGLVGPAARSCGIKMDVRSQHPYSAYQSREIPATVHQDGDCFARAYVRLLEAGESFSFIRRQLTALPAGSPAAEPAVLKPGHLTVSLVEGWRGEICHAAAADSHSGFAFYKVVDPSFHNWFGLAYALRNQQISDFPLCNKSFNLSYCGHDL